MESAAFLCLNTKSGNRNTQSYEVESQFHMATKPQGKTKSKMAHLNCKKSNSCISGPSGPCPPPGTLHYWLLHVWEIRAFSGSQHHHNCKAWVTLDRLHIHDSDRGQSSAKSILNIPCRGFYKRWNHQTEDAQLCFPDIAAPLHSELLLIL